MRLFVGNLLLVLALAIFPPLLLAAEAVGPQVKIEVIETGKGDEAMPFSVVDVHYTGRLDSGEVFDSSVGRGEPFQFTLGAGQVIPGWDMGIKGMKPGGKRVLTIPPGLAYGARGAGDVIPPNATLTFEVELIALVPPPFQSIDSNELRARLDKGIKLIDIRRAEEWKQTGVVESSIESTAFNADGRFLASFVEMLERTVDKGEEFALICRTGNRTAALSNWLVTRGGYKNVLNVRDGITRWIEDGLPVVKTGG